MRHNSTLAELEKDIDSLPGSFLTRMGFRFDQQGVHSSRTIMLKEITLLFDECPAATNNDEYLAAIVEANCLGKRTASNRRISAQRLRELYGLDPSLTAFRIFRYFWDIDEEGRPLLALLTALARDHLLRVTCEPILQIGFGEELARQEVLEALRKDTENRLNDGTLDKVVRNTASSWTQSGHLHGRSRKVRQRVQPTPVVMTYAIALGYILGARGYGVFSTMWARALDLPVPEQAELAMQAKRLGLLTMRQAGGILQISIDPILTDQERMLIPEYS
mgnify:CR=1 FL=1